MAVSAGCGATAGCLTGVLALTAMIDVRARVDTTRSARDERGLTAEMTLAGLTRRGGVRRRRAYLAARATIGGVVRGVDACAATRGLAATGERAGSVFAHLIRAAGLATRTAVLWIRTLIDALVRTVVVAAVATDGALSAAAQRNPVGRRAANFPTRAAVFEVGVEFLATPVARAVARGAGQCADRVLANRAGVWCAVAHFRAVTAVVRIRRQSHARTAAIAGASGTSRAAFAARADLVLLALGSAGAAVVRILVGLDAGTTTFSVADIARRAALACTAG